MKKFISMAIDIVMVLAMAIVSSADLVSEVKIVGTTTAPVLDGNVTEEEWGAPVFTVDGSERKEHRMQQQYLIPYMPVLKVRRHSLLRQPLKFITDGTQQISMLHT
jgi:hypothetical protein